MLVKQGDLSFWENVNTMGGINWESSSLLTGLNQNLYKNMFSKSERAAIQLTVLENTIHDGTAVIPGNDTEDYLFLLSKNEVEKYLELLLPGKREFDGWRSYGDWWTRTVANEDEVKANFSSDTDCTRYMLKVASPISSIGKIIAVTAKDNGYGRPEVIPAMWVDIDKMLESWA